MKNIIQFHVYMGEKYFVASSADIPVITQGKTLDEVAKNIQEAVELHLENENLAELDLEDKPHILVNMEVASERVHA